MLVAHEKKQKRTAKPKRVLIVSAGGAINYFFPVHKEKPNAISFLRWICNNVWMWGNRLMRIYEYGWIWKHPFAKRTGHSIACDLHFYAFCHWFESLASYYCNSRSHVQHENAGKSLKYRGVLYISFARTTYDVLRTRAVAVHVLFMVCNKTNIWIHGKSNCIILSIPPLYFSTVLDRPRHVMMMTIICFIILE